MAVADEALRVEVRARAELVAVRAVELLGLAARRVAQVVRDLAAVMTEPRSVAAILEDRTPGGAGARESNGAVAHPAM